MFWKKDKKLTPAGPRLTAPASPDDSPPRMVYQLLTERKFWFLHGPGKTLGECFDYGTNVVPGLDRSEAVGFGFGKVTTPDDRDQYLWAAYEGDSGSVIFFFMLPEGDSRYVAENVAAMEHRVRDPWACGSIYGTKHFDLPAAVVEIVNGTNPTPIGDIAGLEHLRPRPPEPEEVPIILYEHLASEPQGAPSHMRPRPGRLVELPDPELPEGDLTQFAYTILRSQGITLVVYGPGSLAECHWRCMEAAPVMGRVRRSIDAMEPVGIVAEVPGARWVGLEGPQGSAIVFMMLPDQCDLAVFEERLRSPLSRIRAPWTWDYAGKGARVSEEVSSVLASAQGVDAYNIPGYGALRPPVGAEPELADALREELPGHGWELQARETADGPALPETANYTFPELDDVPVVLYALWGGDLMLAVKLADLPDGRVPAELFECDLGRYTTTVTEQMVLLADSLPDSANAAGNAKEITRRARELLVFAVNLAAPE